MKCQHHGIGVLFAEIQPGLVGAELQLTSWSKVWKARDQTVKVEVTEWLVGSPRFCIFMCSDGPWHGVPDTVDLVDTDKAKYVHVRGRAYTEATGWKHFHAKSRTKIHLSSLTVCCMDILSLLLH